MSEEKGRFLEKSRAIMDEVVEQIAWSVRQELVWNESHRLILGHLPVGQVVRCRKKSGAYWQAFDCAPIGLVHAQSGEVEGTPIGGNYDTLEDARAALFAYVQGFLSRYREDRGW